jgi:hypothetical protein
MTEITFKNKNSVFEKLDLQILQDAILNKGYEYWGDSTSVIKYKDASNDWTMILLYRGKIGFFIWLSSDDVNSENVYTLVQGNDVESVIDIDLPENNWILFKRNFVTQETTWKAVEYFVQTGKMNSNLAWEEFSTPDD